jgi:hypothetical protein
MASASNSTTVDGLDDDDADDDDDDDDDDETNTKRSLTIVKMGLRQAMRLSKSEYP